MAIPVYSLLLIVLSIVSLALGATPSSWWPKLAMVLLLVAGAIPVYDALEKAASGKDVANIGMGVK